MNRTQHRAAGHPYVHPLDPITQHKAAGCLGKLVAQHIISAEEALHALVEVASAVAPSVDPVGLRARLSWTLLDAARHWSLTRSRAELSIKRAMFPLIDTWRPSSEILEAAHAANEAMDTPLLRHEVVTLVANELRWHFRRAQRNAG